MPTLRVIPCLDVDKGMVVKGVNFVGLREMGDPSELAARYEEEGADELVVLDITASVEGRKTFVEVVRNVADAIGIPLAVGGGVRSMEDADRLFKAGADKVSVNTAAVRDPQLVSRMAYEYGSQSTVVAIDAKRAGDRFEVYIYGGRTPTGLDAGEWARRVVELGAGELLVTSIDRDGTQRGYDLDLLSTVVRSVGVPVIASGGAGALEHFYEAASVGVDAVLAASLFHTGVLSIGSVKRYLRDRGIEVRL